MPAHAGLRARMTGPRALTHAFRCAPLRKARGGMNEVSVRVFCQIPSNPAADVSGTDFNTAAKARRTQAGTTEVFRNFKAIYTSSLGCLQKLLPKENSSKIRDHQELDSGMK